MAIDAIGNSFSSQCIAMGICSLHRVSFDGSGDHDARAYAHISQRRFKGERAATEVTPLSYPARPQLPNHSMSSGDLFDDGVLLDQMVRDIMGGINLDPLSVYPAFVSSTLPSQTIPYTTYLT
jgi:hypothetical protein